MWTARVILAMALLAAGCDTKFYCEETPDEDNIRYCYDKPSKCGELSGDVVTGEPRKVTCVQRGDAYCRPDPNEDRVCTWTRDECSQSMPYGLSDTRTGRSASCEWVH